MTSVGERLGLLPDSDFHIVDDPEKTGNLLITRTSAFTRKRNTMSLPIDVSRFMRWRTGGGLIQSIFPELSADQREFLMSGTTPEEWAAVFGLDEGEEDD